MYCPCMMNKQSLLTALTKLRRDRATGKLKRRYEMRYGLGGVVVMPSELLLWWSGNMGNGPDDVDQMLQHFDLPSFQQLEGMLGRATVTGSHDYHWAAVFDLKRLAPHVTPDTPEQQIANLVHHKMCDGNHIEGYCDWHYSSWDKPCDARVEYLAKARKMLTFAGPAVVKAIIEQL